MCSSDLLHNRRMHDALQKVVEWMDSVGEKPEWEARVRASLEDNEP